MLLDPALITGKVTRILETLNVRYFITGSLASTVHGMVRTTQDSDIVAELRQEHVETFIQQLVDDFYIDSEMITRAIIQRSSFNIIHKESFFKVDLIIPKDRPYLQQQMSRARRYTISSKPPSEAAVLSPEDTILSKLEWFRAGGDVSERQWRDVLGILEVQAGNLDVDYLRRWAEELGVSDLFDRALLEATL